MICLHLSKLSESLHRQLSVWRVTRKVLKPVRDKRSWNFLVAFREPTESLESPSVFVQLTKNARDDEASHPIRKRFVLSFQHWQ